MLLYSLIVPLLVPFAKTAYGYSRDVLEPGAVADFRDYDEAPIPTESEETPASGAESSDTAALPQATSTEYPAVKNLQTYLEVWSTNYAQHRGSKYGPEVKSVSIASDLSKFDRLERAIKAAATHLTKESRFESQDEINNEAIYEHSPGLERRSTTLVASVPVPSGGNNGSIANHTHIMDAVNDQYSNAETRTPAIATMGIAVALAACVGMS